MLTIADYFMGRDKTYKEDLNLDIEGNAKDLVLRVNNLFNALQLNVPRVSSGWRPLAVNMRVGGAKRSLHMAGKAVDLLDPGQPGELEKRILLNPHLLLDFGLWMEHPDSTPGWCHLDTGIRDSRFLRVFKP